MLADNSMEVVLGMFFLGLSNADIEFIEPRKLTWKSYTTAEALPATSRVELIDKKEFAKVALNKNLETFVVHISAIEAAENSIHPF